MTKIVAAVGPALLVGDQQRWRFDLPKEVDLGPLGFVRFEVAGAGVDITVPEGFAGWIRNDRAEDGRLVTSDRRVRHRAFQRALPVRLTLLGENLHLDLADVRQPVREAPERIRTFPADQAPPSEAPASDRDTSPRLVELGSQVRGGSPGRTGR